MINLEVEWTDTGAYVNAQGIEWNCPLCSWRGSGVHRCGDKALKPPKKKAVRKSAPKRRSA